MEVSNPAVHPSVVAVEAVAGTHRYERVSDAGDGQYLVVTISVDGTGVEPLELPLAAVAGGHRSDEPIRVGRDEQAGHDRLAFPMPVVDATAAAVIWDRGDAPSPRWQLGPSVVEALGTDAAFELRSWTVPDRVGFGESFEASFTVANVGGRGARFLATFGVEQGSLGVPEVAVRVPAGGTRTVTRTLAPHYFDGIESFPVVLGWDRGRRTAVVDVAAETATETA